MNTVAPTASTTPVSDTSSAARVNFNPYTAENPEEAKSKFVDICQSFNINPQEMLDRLIADFVNMHSFLHPENDVEEEDEEDDDNRLPFN